MWESLTGTATLGAIAGLLALSKPAVKRKMRIVTPLHLRRKTPEMMTEIVIKSLTPTLTSLRCKINTTMLHSSRLSNRIKIKVRLKPKLHLNKMMKMTWCLAASPTYKSQRSRNLW